MRTTLMLAAAVLLAAPAVFANEGGEEGRGEGREHRMERKEGFGGEHLLERLKDKLGLSSDQETKIKAVLDKTKPEMERIRKEMEALHQKAMTQRRQMMEDIRATLDLEQKEKFDRMNAMMGREGPGRWAKPAGEGKGRGGPPEKAGGE